MHLYHLPPFLLLWWAIYITSVLTNPVVTASTSTYCSCHTTLPSYAPIPSSAIGPKINTTLGYRTQFLDTGVYMVTTGFDQSIFFIHTTGVIVVDAPPSLSPGLYYAIRNITSLPITHLIYSHTHADHIGGAHTLLFLSSSSPSNNNNSVEIIAHHDTATILTEILDPKRPLPTTTFQDTYKLQAGNQTLELSYHGLAHSPGNIFVYAPAQKILMVVDIITPGWGGFKSLGIADNPLGIYSTLSTILSYDFSIFIAGHNNLPGSRADIVLQKEYLDDMKSNCNETIIASGVTSSKVYQKWQQLEGQVDQQNLWASTKVYFDLVAEECSEVTNQKWEGRLAAVEVFGVDNAFSVIEMLRLDYGVLGPFGEKS